MSRSDTAGLCPSEEELAAQLRSRLHETYTGSKPLAIEVAISAEGTDFTAVVRVSGRQHGERSLRAQGPACDALRDALLVTLLLVLDEVPENSPEPEPPAPPAPTPPKPPQPAARARPLQRAPTSSERLAAPPTAGWITAGGALTHGLPTDFSVALYADFAVRIDSVEVSVGGFWTPERRVTYTPGTVVLDAWGGRVRGCYRLPFARPPLLLRGCGLGVVAALRGEAEGFTRNSSKQRAWWLVGAGPELRWSFAPRLALGATLQALVTAHREGFEVQNLERDDGYVTDRVLGWAGLDVSLQIW